MKRFVLGTILVMVIPGVLFGEINWFECEIDTNNVLWAIYSADIDGDGDKDVVAGGSPAWWENLDGIGLEWEKHTVDASIGSIMSIYTKDLDGDGDEDVMAVHGQYDVSWWENTDGNGNFGSRISIDSDFERPRSICAADIDGDGDNDVLGASYWDDDICWWRNNGANPPVFTRDTVDADFDGAYSVCAVKIDNDNFVDVVGGADTGDEVAWWKNVDGSGTNWIKNHIDDINQARSVCTADMNDDGYMDVVAVGCIADSIVWWQNLDGSGTSWQRYTIADDCDGSWAAYTTDLDMDGDVDVVASSYSGNSIAWWENLNGLGTSWQEYTIADDVSTPRCIYAEDLDTDGDIDVLGGPYVGDITFWRNGLILKDAGTVTLDIPDIVLPNSVIEIPVYVKNFGSDTANFDVTCNIDPSAYDSTETVTNLAPGDSIQIIFPAFTFESGSYNVMVYTQLENDEIPANDTLKKLIHVMVQDARPVSIDIPDYVLSNTTLNPQATLKNEGTNTETFNVTCFINDPGTYTSTVTVSNLTPGASVQDTFVPPFTFASGSYTVTVYTQLANDDYPNNDTLEKIVTTDGIPPEPFSLIAPEDSTMLSNPRPTFIWRMSNDAVSGVKEYEVYIDAVLKYTLTDTIWTPNSNLQEDWHNWYVIAYDNVGNQCQSSETWSVLIDVTHPSVVNLISPSDSAHLNNNTINFIWNTSNDALSGIKDYVLQYSSDISFTSGVIETTVVDTNFTAILPPDTTYYWRVKARDRATNESAWSLTWNFEIDTQTPNVPTIVSPIGGTYLCDTLVHFEWTEVTNVVSFSGHISTPKRMKSSKGLEKFLDSRSDVLYIVQIDTMFDFNAPIITDTVETTSTAILIYSGFYYWRVMSFDLAGNQSPYADPDSFGVDITAPLIESTTVWIDTSFAGPFEVKTKVTDDLSGVDAARLYYRRNEDPMWFYKDMNPLGSSGWYVDSIPSVINVNDTIRYYLRADDRSEPLPGNIVTDPEGAPANYYWFIANHHPGIMDFGDNPTSFYFGLKSNPAKGHAVFNLALPKPGSITLRIYDVSGRLIDKLISEKSTGYYEIPWTSPRTAGVYFYHLESSWGKKVGKLVLVR